jgi:hypothetical protein
MEAEKYFIRFDQHLHFLTVNQRKLGVQCQIDKFYTFTTLLYGYMLMMPTVDAQK